MISYDYPFNLNRTRMTRITTDFHRIRAYPRHLCHPCPIVGFSLNRWPMKCYITPLSVSMNSQFVSFALWPVFSKRCFTFWRSCLFKQYWWSWEMVQGITPIGIALLWNVLIYLVCYHNCNSVFPCYSWRRPIWFTSSSEAPRSLHSNVRWQPEL